MKRKKRKASQKGAFQAWVKKRERSLCGQWRQDKKLWQIARRFRVTVGRIGNAIALLRRQGKDLPRRWANKAGQKAREKAVLKLRRKKKSNAKIARSLRISVRQVSSTIGKLIRKRLLTPRHKPLSLKQRKRRLQRALKLWDQWKQDEEVAERLVLSLSSTRNLKSQLIAAGKLSAHETARKPRDCLIRRPSDPKFRKVVRLSKKGKTLEEIGRALKCTRENVRTLRNRIIAIHGPEVFGLNDQFLDIAQIAESLRMSPDVARALLKKHGLKPDAHFGKDLWRPNVAKPLRQAIKKSHQRWCRFCRKKFTYKKNDPRVKVCRAKRCRKKWQHERNAANRSGVAPKSPLKGWHLLLKPALASQQAPKREQWVSITQAKKLSLLSPMQIYWLQVRSLVKVRHHRAKKWGGQPVRLFAASQLQIAGQIWRQVKQ